MQRDSYKRGSTNSVVRRIQARLKELGYYVGPTDGIFGVEMEKAVKSFQKTEHLTVDGIVGPQTWNLLFSSFKISNYSRHVGKRGKFEWYEWKVFVDEPVDKLERIIGVEYRLHETFPNPIRVIDDRNSKFALRSSGWGEFWIFISIYLNDGTEEHTQYYLDLGKSWPSDDNE